MNEEQNDGLEDNKSLDQPTFEQLLSHYYIDVTKLITLLPLLSLLGLVYGSTRIYFYYLSFGFNIFNYINLTEIVNIAVKDIITIIVVSFMLLSVYMMFNSLVKKIVGKIILIILVITLSVFVFAMAGFTIMQVVDFLFGTLTTIFFFTFFIVVALIFQKNGKVIIMLTTLFLVFCAWRTASIYSYLVLEKNITMGNYVQLNNHNLIKSEGSKYYLGKTNDYVYFYERDSLSVEVYKVENIELFSIKNDF